MLATRKKPTRPAAEVAAWCERFEALCRGQGVRVTPQRMAVYKALSEDTAHPSADRLFERLRRQMPTLSLMTVYRILESLEELGVVRRVSTPGGVSRFDANVEPHQHLVCRRCGRMSDHHSHGLSGVELPSGKMGGFLPEEIDIRIVGLCVACQRPPRPQPNARAGRHASTTHKPSRNR
jgi:Fur family peroxide stress response transcriptional regulator